VDITHHQEINQRNIKHRAPPTYLQQIPTASANNQPLRTITNTKIHQPPSNNPINTKPTACLCPIIEKVHSGALMLLDGSTFNF